MWVITYSFVGHFFITQSSNCSPDTPHEPPCLARPVVIDKGGYLSLMKGRGPSRFSLVGAPRAGGREMADDLLPVPITQVGVIIRPGEDPVPAIIDSAGGAARFAWDEFFQGEIRNGHT